MFGRDFLQLSPNSDNFNGLIIDFDDLILYVFIHCLNGNIGNWVTFLKLIFKVNCMIWVGLFSDFSQRKNFSRLLFGQFCKVCWWTNWLTIYIHHFVRSNEEIFEAFWAETTLFWLTSDLCERKFDLPFW